MMPWDNFSFASVGVHAIEASARFHGVVAGMRLYLLAVKASGASASGGPQGGRGLRGFKLRRHQPSSFQATEDSRQPVVRMGARKDDT
jgi:hypothetical protein